MNFTLKRYEFGSQGIFGTLYGDNNTELAVTLEHAYLDKGSWVAKVAPGVYTCIRHTGRLGYETWMLQSVPPFQGVPVNYILIHKGNFDKNSEGCILVGKRETKFGSGEMITDSKTVFDALMALTIGVPTIQLTIIGALPIGVAV